MGTDTTTIQSGIEALDQVLQGIRLGDNVVWQVDRLEDYGYFAEPFAEAAIAGRRRLVYLRFASHPPVLAPRPELEMIELDPSQGFDSFTRQVHSLIEARGGKVFYVFDNLSALVAEWATDELLANFFQATCPFLFELDTVAYFALTRGQHAHQSGLHIFIHLSRRERWPHGKIDEVAWQVVVPVGEGRWRQMHLHQGDAVVG